MSDTSITIELNPEERRLYDRLRGRVVADRPLSERSSLGDLALLLPDLTVLLMRLLQDDRVPILQKAVSVAGVAYVLSPIDVLPALFFGPVGLIDDLVIVAACLSGLLNRVHPDVVRSHWSGQGDALDAIALVTEWIEENVVGGLRSVMARVFSRRLRL